jgi:hypothetical protein
MQEKDFDSVIALFLAHAKELKTTEELFSFLDDFESATDHLKAELRKLILIKFREPITKD